MFNSFFLFLIFFYTLNSAITIDDFSQLNKTNVSKICYPTCTEEFKNILSSAKKDNLKISVAGKLHSQGGHAFYPDNIVIDITKFNKILNLDIDKKIISVQVGATWEQIQEFINPYNLAIKVMQTTQIFTVGGSLSVNCHGRDPNFGPLIETIESLKILLASGEIVEASRTQNYELFKLAIGGYGLFGIILEADIQLTENLVYKKKARVIRTSNYASYIQNQVVGNNLLGLHYGIICMAPYNGFKKMLAINYEILPKSKKIKSSAYILEDEKFVAIKRRGLDLRRQSRLFNFCSEVGEWPFVVFNENLRHITCRNNAMRHPAKVLAHNATKNTDVLQSYFIPLNSFNEFMQFLKKNAKAHDLKIMYVLTRYIPKNQESFLSYSNENYIEIVIFINHGIKLKEVKHAKKWTRKIIDQVLKYGGNFYLPVRCNASYDQLIQAYPQIQDLFSNKLKYDPHEIFFNNFYKKYAKESKLALGKLN